MVDGPRLVHWSRCLVASDTRQFHNWKHPLVQKVERVERVFSFLSNRASGDSRVLFSLLPSPFPLLQHFTLTRSSIVSQSFRVHACGLAEAQRAAEQRTNHGPKGLGTACGGSRVDPWMSRLFASGNARTGLLETNNFAQGMVGFFWGER